MNKNELLKKLEVIIYNYIEDETFANELIKFIESTKIKYVLSELEINKKKDYIFEDKELIKDIYFYYC